MKNVVASRHELVLDKAWARDHTEPSKEKRLTKRSEKSYKAKIQCLADWSMVHDR